MQSNAMPCHAMQCHAMQCNPMPCNPIQCNPLQSNAMQCNAMQCNAMQYARHCANRDHGERHVVSLVLKKDRWGERNEQTRVSTVPYRTVRTTNEAIDTMHCIDDHWG
mmetsp:Transcript_13045/g.26673  ORF Transcript_13045/g.26673 Transcript_13045/m.26673 type:complete len:108 (+) Transcript_13045:902-1225(+)